MSRTAVFAFTVALVYSVSTARSLAGVNAGYAVKTCNFECKALCGGSQWLVMFMKTVGGCAMHWVHQRQQKSPHINLPSARWAAFCGLENSCGSEIRVWSVNTGQNSFLSEKNFLENLGSGGSDAEVVRSCRKLSLNLQQANFRQLLITSAPLPPLPRFSKKFFSVRKDSRNSHFRTPTTIGKRHLFSKPQNAA